MRTDDNKPWFTLDQKSVNLDVESERTSLFRIIPFDALLQMLNEKRNILVHTEKWEDVYENFLLHEVFVRGEKEVPIYRLARRFYGQCWTKKMTSDALWRIYSPDKKSVRIKTSLGKLMASMPQNTQNGFFLVGKVDYYNQSKIEEDLKTLKGITLDQLTLLMFQSLFVKRNSFSHESEYRMVFMKNSEPKSNSDVISFPIEPLDFIENIYFDPRADDAYVDRCTKVLISAFNYPKARIKKSQLYSFNPVTIHLL